MSCNFDKNNKFPFFGTSFEKKYCRTKQFCFPSRMVFFYLFLNHNHFIFFYQRCQAHEIEVSNFKWNETIGKHLSASSLLPQPRLICKHPQEPLLSSIATFPIIFLIFNIYFFYFFILCKNADFLVQFGFAVIHALILAAVIVTQHGTLMSACAQFQSGFVRI